nr:MAG: hypothetical protein CM15mV30_0240 [uncultured marine virus]
MRPSVHVYLLKVTLFAQYPKESRVLSYVKILSNAISRFKINIPTPVLAVKVRTPIRQFASCVLM